MLLIIASAIILFAACNNGSSDENSDGVDSTTVETEDVTQISVGDFELKAEEYIEQTIQIEGTVSHICKHGGKKMFIFQAPVDTVTVKITSNESFSVDLEGSDVIVTGIVKEERITAADILEMEEELKEHENEEENDGENDEEHHDKHISQETIDYYNALLEKSDKDYIAFYTLECVEYEEK